jgi:hypothetical protein
MKTDDSDEYEYCCTDCGGVILPEAKTCPHCGADTSSLVESSMYSRMKELEMRLAALEARIPNSDVISHKFWSRAFAILGHQLAITLVFYAIILVIAILFGVLSTIGSSR